MRIVERGTALEELVKGSLNYVMHTIRNAFYDQYGRSRPDDERLWIAEIFVDHIIVSSDELAVDEYYFIPYERDGENVSFASRDEWEVVELAYQPANVEERLDDLEVEERRFKERCSEAVELIEADDEDSSDGPWEVRAIGITADVVNRNGRRYPASVLRAAVKDMKTHLHESAGQGRAVVESSVTTGEPDHPSDKGNRRPLLAETVINWTDVEFDGTHVILEGLLMGTRLGKDIRAQMRGGIIPGVSQRGYGKSEYVEEDGRQVEVVRELTITGYDLTPPNEQSDKDAGIEWFESIQKGDEPMELDLEKLKERYPELVAQLKEEADQERREALKAELEKKQREDERIQKMIAEREEELRDELDLKDTDNLFEAIREREQRRKKLERKEQRRKVQEYIEDETEDLDYPLGLREELVEAVKDAEPETTEDAKQVIIEERKRFDKIASKLELGLQGKGVDVTVLGPVLENEKGVPEFARVSHELNESLVKAGLAEERDLRDPQNRNERFAREYLERFDKQYKHHLQREAKLWQEAEQTTDLNLPYSVARSVIAEAVPELVAVSVFDVAMTDQSEFRLYYEEYSAESGAAPSITDEAATSDEGAWVDLDNARIQPGTVTVTGSGGTPTYTEGTDYVIDYADGQLWTLAAGSIGDGTTLEVDYTYDAFRKGEMQAIERGKNTLSFETVTVAADRLATEISNEAIVFARSQIGWDAVTRTLNSLAQQVREKIDKDMFYEGLAAALIQASNSGGSWASSSDAIADLVEYIGQAKVKVLNRFYRPTAIVTSVTNADRLSNWDGFKRDGFPDAVLNAAGFVGRVKGLPVFETVNFTDDYILVCNRELVMHRVYQAMQFKGPFPSYDSSTGELIAAEQYYAEEYNATEHPVEEKGSYVEIT